MKTIINKIIFLFSFLGVLTGKIISCFWKSFICLFYYLSFVFLSIKFDWTSNLLHQILFVIFFVTFFFFFYKGAKNFSWPKKNKILHDIETRNAVKRGSLISQKEKNIIGDETLWQRFQNKTKQALPFLKPSKVKTDISKNDPFALRFISILMLVITFSFSYPFSSQSFKENFVPVFTAPLWLLPTQPQMTAWIIPPEYTGIKPTALNQETVQPVFIPEGSRLNISVKPFRKKSFLSFSGSDEKIPFQNQTKELMTLDTLVSKDTNEISVYLKEKLKYRWNSFIVDDKKPEIRFSADPQITNNKSIHIQFTAEDDYGIRNINLTIDLAESFIGKPEPMVLEIPRPLSYKKNDSRIYEGQFFQDLTAHQWSGKSVALTLTAEDDYGHIVSSEPFFMQLPTRVFTNIVSQKLIEIRNNLLDNYAMNRTEGAKSLEYILIRPALYHESPTVFLLLKSVFNRLSLDNRLLEEQSTTDMLWDIALYLEEGQLFEKQKELRKAQNDLMKALHDEKIPTDMLISLLEDYQNALKNMMAEVYREIERQMALGQMPAIPFNPEMMDADGFDKMMQELEYLAETGQREKLLEALMQIQNMMEKSRPQALTPEQMQGLESLQDLGQILEEQTQLLDKTKETDQKQRLNQTEPEGLTSEIGQLSEQQGDISEKLKQALEKINEIVPLQGDSSLIEALFAMENSKEALSQSLLNDSIEAQQEALEKLQQGLNETMENMQQNLNMTFTNSPFAIPMPGRGISSIPSQGQYDPFGRNISSKENIFLEETQDEDALERSKEIIRELRKRAGQRQREKQELDYIQRLLDRF